MFKKKKVNKVEPIVEFEYPLSFEEWSKELGVSSRFQLDTAGEEEEKSIRLEAERQIKELKIQTMHKYCNLNQNLARL